MGKTRINGLIAPGQAAYSLVHSLRRNAPAQSFQAKRGIPLEPLTAKRGIPRSARNDRSQKFPANCSTANIRVQGFCQKLASAEKSTSSLVAPLTALNTSRVAAEEGSGTPN